MHNLVRVQQPFIYFQDALTVPLFGLGELQTYKFAERVKAF